MKLYHGTKDIRLESIKKYGLGGVKLFGYRYLTGFPKVWLTTDLNDAKEYGRMNLGSSSTKVIVLEIDTEEIDISKLRDEGILGIYTYSDIITNFKVLEGV